MIRKLAALSVFAGTLFAQRSVPPEYMYHHVYAVLPLVGAGTAADPKRPLLVPSPAAKRKGDEQGEGLLSYQMQLSDDGKFALVELVFQSPLTYQNFLVNAITSQSSGVAIGSIQQPSLAAVSRDGSNTKSLNANIEALKSAFESSIPGVKLLERGKATAEEIQDAFKAKKANFAVETGFGRAQ